MQTDSRDVVALHGIHVVLFSHLCILRIVVCAVRGHNTAVRARGDAHERGRDVVLVLGPAAYKAEGLAVVEIAVRPFRTDCLPRFVVSVETGEGNPLKAPVVVLQRDVAAVHRHVGELRLHRCSRCVGTVGAGRGDGCLHRSRRMGRNRHLVRGERDLGVQPRRILEKGVRPVRSCRIQIGAEGVRLLLVGIVCDRQIDWIVRICVAQGNLRRGHSGDSLFLPGGGIGIRLGNGGRNVDETRALVLDGLLNPRLRGESALYRVGKENGVGRVLEHSFHCVGGGRRIGFEHQRGCSRRVRSGHRGSREFGVALLRGLFVQRIGGCDLAAGGEDVRFELEVGRHSPRREGGDHRGRIGVDDRLLLVRPGDHRVVPRAPRYEPFELFTLLLGDRADREIGCRMDRSPDDAVFIVVDQQADGAVGLCGGGLFGKGGIASGNQRHLSFERLPGKVDRSGLLPVRVCGELCASSRRRDGGAVDGHVCVGGAVGRREGRQKQTVVVHRPYGDGLGGHRRGAARERAVGAFVPLRDSQDHAGIDEGVCGDGGGILRPCHVGRANRHVDNIHAVPRGALHRGEHDARVG